VEGAPPRARRVPPGRLCVGASAGRAERRAASRVGPVQGSASLGWRSFTARLQFARSAHCAHCALTAFTARGRPQTRLAVPAGRPQQQPQPQHSAQVNLAALACWRTRTPYVSAIGPPRNDVIGRLAGWPSGPSGDEWRAASFEQPLTSPKGRPQQPRANCDLRAADTRNPLSRAHSSPARPLSSRSSAHRPGGSAPHPPELHQRPSSAPAAPHALSAPQARPGPPVRRPAAGSRGAAASAAPDLWQAVARLASPFQRVASPSERLQTVRVWRGGSPGGARALRSPAGQYRRAPVSPSLKTPPRPVRELLGVQFYDRRPSWSPAVWKGASEAARVRPHCPKARSEVAAASVRQSASRRAKFAAGPAGRRRAAFLQDQQCGPNCCVWVDAARDNCHR